MELVIHPNPVLQKRCDPVERFDKDMLKFFVDLFLYTEQMRAIFKDKGISVAGLAAPQVGEPIRAFIAFGDQAFANPEVIRKSDHTIEYSEKCFSLPLDKDYPVKRHYSITLRWQDEDGKFKEGHFKGQKAQIIQHELDHINGILLIDKPEYKEHLKQEEANKKVEEKKNGPKKKGPEASQKKS